MPKSFFLPLVAVVVIACTSPAGPSFLTSAPPPQATATPEPTSALPAPTPNKLASSVAWIEVNLTRQVVVLHKRDQAPAEFLAASGVMTDTKFATPPGLYEVQSKEKGPIENVPGVFVADIVMFDLYNGNAIHSRPMDAEGQILEDRLGQPVTAGCVRVGESARVFDFAQIGMSVWIHY
jgi:lipoprotein-anchoring transpeptidase ErfK/SrfK